MTDPRAALSEVLTVAGQALRPPDRGFWIYGAGGFGRSLARELRRLDHAVVGFLDRRGRETRAIDGLPCVHPEDVGPDAIRGTYYTHGIMNWATPSADVLAWAETQDFARLVFPADLYGLPGFSLESYWMAPPDRTVRHGPDLRDLHDALDDEESRRLLVDLLRFRLTSDPRLHPAADLAGTYVQDFLPIRGRPITFVDAGAYTGDTFEALRRAGIEFAEWIAVEPDADNVAALQETARRHRRDSGNFTLIRAGLGASNGTARFSAACGASSRVIEEAELGNTAMVEVPIVRLDDVLRRSGDLYVKMDIEGSELGALSGMTELLQASPALAISVYHRPEDLWEIPRRVRELYDRPRLRLRQHGYQGFDTVLYVTRV